MIVRKEVPFLEKRSVQRLALGGIMTALVFVMTYFPKIPVPATGGYVHLGDGVIFLSAAVLGGLAIPVAAIGSMLSDLVGGYVIYALPTFLIKGLMALIAWKMLRHRKPLSAAGVYALAECAMAAGYFLTESILMNVAAAWGALLPNLMQGAAGVLFGLMLLSLAPRLEKVLR